MSRLESIRLVHNKEKDRSKLRSHLERLLWILSGAAVWTAALYLSAAQIVRQVYRLAEYFHEPDLAAILAQLRNASVKTPFWLLILLFFGLTGWLWLAGRRMIRRHGQTLIRFRLRFTLALLISLLLTVAGLTSVMAFSSVHDIPLRSAIRAFQHILPALTGSVPLADLPASQLVVSESQVWLKDNTCASNGSGWLAGYAQSDIAIDLKAGGPFYIAGYRNGYPATGILDPQKAHAIYLDDQSGSGGVLLLSIDCIGLSSTDVAIIRDSLEPLTKEAGIRAVHVLASHTHAGIDTLGLWGPVGIGGKNDMFMAALYDAARAAAQAAYADRKAGRFFAGSVEIPDMQQDSRLPHVFDRTLTVLRFAPADGGSGFRLVNFAAHAEALRSANTLVSADFPSYLAEGIRNGSGDETFFTAGAIGGLIMTRRLSDTSGRELSVLENVRKTGQILADAALSIQDEVELQPSLLTASAAVRIDLENPVFVMLRFLGAISTKAVRGGGLYSLAVETSVSLLSVGGIKILMIPGEIFPELVSGSDYTGVHPDVQNPPPLVELLGDDLIIFGLSNDEIGYIVTPNDFLIHARQPYTQKAIDQYGRKHYEETNAVGNGAAWAIARAVELLAAETGGGQRIETVR